MKYAIITGANGGLGSYLSKRLIDDNYFVIMLYHTGDDKVKALHELYPNSTLVYKCDITNEKEVENIKELITNKGINIDLLINNAGIDITGELEDKNMDTFINTYKVNAVGAFFMIKYFGENIDNNHGNIINISSENTLTTYDVVSIEYDMSKAALNMLTLEFARLYKQARVNALAPTWMDTPMVDEDIKQFIQCVPLEVVYENIKDIIESDKTGEIILVK
jgi:NAD(P)-dependent dehydrogenase (short-subunit alcohol dehydrogenase family)